MGDGALLIIIIVLIGVVIYNAISSSKDSSRFESEVNRYRRYLLMEKSTSEFHRMQANINSCRISELEAENNALKYRIEKLEKVVKNKKRR